MTIDAYPCYGCLAAGPRWRGPKLGWLCLACFASTVPVVRVHDLSKDDHVTSQAQPSEEQTPLVQEITAARWTLTLKPGPDAPPEVIDLGKDLDAEQAVTEAKWLLGQRQYTSRVTA